MDSRQPKRRRIGHETESGQEVILPGQQQDWLFSFEPGIPFLPPIKLDRMPERPILPSIEPYEMSVYPESSSNTCLAPWLLDKSSLDPPWPIYNDVSTYKFDQPCIIDQPQFSELMPILPLPSSAFESSPASFQSFQSFQPLSIDSNNDVNTTNAYHDDLLCLTDTIQPLDSDLVCFGRITSIDGKWEQKDTASLPQGRLPVELLSNSHFRGIINTELCGDIMPEHEQVIHGLLEEDTLKLYASCTISEDATLKKQPKEAKMFACELDITIYGPFDLLGEIGTWLEKYEVYLQDPLECHHDVQYCNPQRLSCEDRKSCPLVSTLVSQPSQLPVLRDLPKQPDLLDVLSSHIQLEEAEQPAAIQTSLQSHQKQALTFMLQREQGWSFDNSRPDMWEIVDTDEDRQFFNRISEVYQNDKPQNFSGGIIADPMGLGKTLTMISLVAADLMGYNKTPVYSAYAEAEEKSPVPATLIIIPPSLIGSWEDQLTRHLLPGALKCLRHHGTTKLTHIDELQGVNIVLTSYHTVSTEWKSGRGSENGNSVLFSVQWRRIILDEAHFIRNGHSRMAKAVCSLEAVSRWAVTGTPIQNRLGDLATLLSFIRAYPYTDPKRFEADISRLWKSGEDEKAAKRLETLSSYLILRRPKAIIELPQQHDLLYPVNLCPEERDLYNQIREQALVRIDEALCGDSEKARARVYINALQKIESLRLVCDLGLHYHTRDTAANNHAHMQTQAREQWTREAQNVFNTHRDMESIVCVQCLSTLELIDNDSASGQQPKTMALFSQCLKFMCTDCVKKMRQVGGHLACSHHPPCPVAPVSISNAVLEELTENVDGRLTNIPFKIPSKVEALLESLNTLPPDTKCVVFSTWRLTLDVIQKALDERGIQNIRFDGKVPQKERQSVIDSFQTNASINIMLLTLSCGAVGLTLTAATRAYLMEPHWNPTLEDQALARIHRLGQTKEVTTVRFFVRDSFEQEVMKLQESKKSLANIILSHHDTGQVNDNLEELHKLRMLL